MKELMVSSSAKQENSPSSRVPRCSYHRLLCTVRTKPGDGKFPAGMNGQSWVIQEKVEDLAFTCCSEDVAVSARLLWKLLSLCRTIRGVSAWKVHWQTFAGSVTLCKTTPEGLNLQAGEPAWDGLQAIVYCVVLVQDNLWKKCTDSLLIFTSSFHLPSASSFTSPWRKHVLPHKLSITVVTGSCFPSWSLQMYENQESWNQDVHYRPWRRLLSFLSGWWISEKFVDFRHFHFCLLDSTNLGLILILLKSMAKFPLTSKEMV